MTDKVYKRKLTAILSADVVGYSRLMEKDEAATVNLLKSNKNLISEKVQTFNGRVVDSPGDNILSEFRSIVDAVACAVAIQETLRKQNETSPENRKMYFRIGVNLGDVIQDGDRIYGDGVNIAARIEGLAKPGEVTISGTALDNVRNKLEFGFKFVGEHQVKNIAQPIRVYRVLTHPASLGKIIGEPSDDPSTVQKTKLAVAVVILLVAATYLYLAYKPTENLSAPKSSKPSIAVLPFANMSDDPQQEYFSEGITDDLITDLSKVSGLMVISRNSTFTYKGIPFQIKQVARELGVEYVLEGSVRKIGDQIRINAQLIDAEKDHHIWAERYDGQMADVFDLQDQITEKIVNSLAVELTAREISSRKEYETRNILAYDEFLKGWNYFLRQTPEDVPQAIPHLKKAFELDPDYSRAYAALALVYWRAVDQGWRKQLKLSSVAARLLASNYLDKAMKRPNSTAYLLAAEVADRMLLLETAHSDAEKAVALAPNDHWALFTLGQKRTQLGRFEEGLAYLKKSLEHDPQNPGRIWQSMAWSQLGLGNYEEALALAERARQYNPSTTSIGGILAILYAQLSRQKEAKEAFAFYKKGWPADHPPTIPLVMMFYSFTDPKISAIIVEALLKAGLPPEPSEYYKPWMLEKLREKEIKNLLLSKTISGMGLFSSKQWWWMIDADGAFKTRGGGFGDKDGSLWIEDDLLCSNIPKMTRGLILKGAICRNKEGVKEKHNEYLLAAIWGLMPFSLQ